MKNSNISCAILAGGKNSRMNGVDKAFINMNGVPIIRRAINALKELFDEIIIVTNTPEKFKEYGNECVIVADIIKDKGPIGGIHSALNHTSKDKVFIAACDMPFLNAGFIKKILSAASDGDYDCIIPKTGKGIEPLSGVYSKSILEKTEELLDGDDFSVRRLLENCKCGYVEADKEEMECFININTPEDLQKLSANGN
ncbi:molybdenum cofactor guanylyltransferase [bacterium]|nr:molybdenum cofactor guanylyltransferase [bacterium]MBU3955758.1 molybdenum cofactor guanylyltransferase [bacterium]